MGRSRRQPSKWRKEARLLAALVQWILMEF